MRVVCRRLYRSAHRTAVTTTLPPSPRGFTTTSTIHYPHCALRRHRQTLYSEYKKPSIYTKPSNLQPSTRNPQIYSQVHKAIKFTAKYTESSNLQPSTQSHQIYGQVHKILESTAKYTKPLNLQPSTQSHQIYGPSTQVPRIYSQVHKILESTAKYTKPLNLQQVHKTLNLRPSTQNPRIYGQVHKILKSTAKYTSASNLRPVHKTLEFTGKYRKFNLVLVQRYHWNSPSWIQWKYRIYDLLHEYSAQLGREDRNKYLQTMLKLNNFLDIFFLLWTDKWRQRQGGCVSWRHDRHGTPDVREPGDAETAEGAASSPDLKSYDMVDEYPAIPSEPAATTQQQPSTHIPVSSRFLWGGGGGGV